MHFITQLLSFAHDQLMFLRTRFSKEKLQDYGEPERIVGKRTVDGQVQYYVKWKNYGDNENTWEPGRNLKNYGHLIKNFDRISMIM
jgi:Chromo (CHRromatin Organisation MOdifier) domain